LRIAPRLSIERLQPPLTRKSRRSTFCQGLPSACHAQEHLSLLGGTAPVRHLATLVGVPIVVIDLLHGVCPRFLETVTAAKRDR
jgi:hypothetical protein